MKILLLQLYSGVESPAVYPLGLSYLYTALSACDHDIKILDQNLCGDDPFSATEKILMDFMPDVVGISIRNIRVYSARKEFIDTNDAIKRSVDAVKKVSNKTVVIVGGPAFSMFPERFMRNEPRINFGVFLEGEESLPLLLKSLDCPEKVKGIFYRNKEEIVFTGENIPIKFTSSTEPIRAFNPPTKYSGEYSVGVQSKRGCTLKCNYCNYIFLSGNKLRLRDAKSVVDEIEGLIKNYNLHSFAFTDNVFNTPLAHAKEICHEIIVRGVNVRWSAWFNEKFIDNEFIDLAIKAGCRKFEFSSDGYSDQSLRWLNKNIQRSHIDQVYKLIKKKSGIKVEYNFMLGIPGQNIFQLAMLALFCIRLRFSFRERVRINFSKLGIEPGTELQRLAAAENVITADTDLYLPAFYCVGMLGVISRFKKLVLPAKRNQLRDGE